MTSDDIIETAAKAMYEELTAFDWETALPLTQQMHRKATRAALEVAGVELPSESLPVDQVRREPDTSNAWQKRVDGRWHCAHLYNEDRLTDDDVRDWPVLVPETDLDEAREARFKAENKISAMLDDLNDLRGERDRFLARVAELEATEPQSVDADALAKAINKAHDVWGGQVLADTIREHLPATTRPALPDVPVAVDMRGWTEDGLQDLSEMRPDAGTTIAAANIASAAARAELARRATEAGVSS